MLARSQLVAAAGAAVPPAPARPVSPVCPFRVRLKGIDLPGQIA